MLRENAHENVEHVLSEFKIRVSLNEDEGHGFVDDWCKFVSRSGKTIQKCGHQTNREDAHISVSISTSLLKG